MEVKIHVRNMGGADIFSINMTGQLHKFPIDTADIVARDGTQIAKVKW